MMKWLASRVFYGLEWFQSIDLGMWGRCWGAMYETRGLGDLIEIASDLLDILVPRLG